MPYLGIFGPEFYKNCCQVWNQHPPICLIASFWEETKMPKFGTKNALFEYFWAGIRRQYCHIWNLHLPICLFAKIFEIMKMPKFATKNALFR